jgi:hypothetical protein
MSNLSVEALLILTAILCVYFALKADRVSALEQVPSGQMPVQMPVQMQLQQTQPIIVGGDDRYSIAPRPQRMWQAPLEGSSRVMELDSIATRGPPEQYQQMGVINDAAGKVLPLYGRRVAARSDYFNYYTRTDTYNPVPLPIRFKKRDCQDNVGCHEIMSGDEVHISPTGESAKVTLYGFDGPRYQ